MDKRKSYPHSTKVILEKNENIGYNVGMREIVLDTETTGVSPEAGDRIVEIGCVELINHLPTGKTYQVYLNPERQMSDEVIQIHGITNEQVANAPKFCEIADEFLEFIGQDPLVIHNAPFDMKFLNMELQRADKALLSMNRAIDTLPMARKKYPGAQASLDALCKRFSVDASRRTKHGALLDSELLAEVYLAMILDKEFKFGQHSENKEKNNDFKNVSRETLVPRTFDISSEELAAHQQFVSKIKDNLWQISEMEEIKF